MIFDASPALGEPQKDPTHTANFGVKLREKLQGIGVGYELAYSGTPDVKHAGMEEFLIWKPKERHHPAARCRTRTTRLR